MEVGSRKHGSLFRIRKRGGYVAETTLKRFSAISEKWKRFFEVWKCFMKFLGDFETFPVDLESFKPLALSFMTKEFVSIVINANVKFLK